MAAENSTAEILLAKLAKVDPYALEQMADFNGPSVFNPVIGGTPAETFYKLEQGMQFLHGMISDDDGALDCDRGGLALYVQTLWAAVQYEAFRCKENQASGG